MEPASKIRKEKVVRDEPFHFDPDVIDEAVNYWFDSLRTQRLPSGTVDREK